MRILHIISSMNPASGGPAEAIRHLGSAQLRMGDEAEVASLDPPNALFLREYPLRIYPLGPSKTGYAFSSKLMPWLEVNRSRYDAFVVHGLWQFHSFAAWSVLRSSKTPYVLFTHGMLDPWFKRRYPLKHLKKWMYWPWAEYRVLRDARAVAFTCEEERVLARSSFWLYRCHEAVIGLGTAKPKNNPQLDLGEFFASYPVLRQKRILLFMGRIHPKKGCDLLIDAFARVLGSDPDWYLVFAGPDQVGWQAELEQLTKERGVASRVVWTGLVSGRLKWGALQAAEVFALPSHQENFGIAVAEALAVGVPALISHKVNIWREIENDQAGIVAADDLEGTCEVLRSYCQRSEADRFAMRCRARECFARRFEITRTAEALQSLLGSAAA